MLFDNYVLGLTNDSLYVIALNAMADFTGEVNTLKLSDVKVTWKKKLLYKHIYVEKEEGGSIFAASTVLMNSNYQKDGLKAFTERFSKR